MILPMGDVNIKIKLPADIKTSWLAALRDPTRKQGRKQLKNMEDNSFCCLGVLCDIQPGFNWDSLDGKNYWGNLSYPHFGNWQLVPAAHKCLMQKTYDEGPRVEVFLGHMNDLGNSFGEIANWIEEHL